MTTKSNEERERNLRLVEAAFHEAAVVASEDAPQAEEDAQAVARILARARDDAAAHFRKDLERADAERLAATPRRARAGLLAMTRQALMASAAELVGRVPGGVAFQHRDLEGMTDTDLRSAVADLEALLGVEEE